tara:strand:+ start:486 stop:599 length:114 start_codon:yes stop_codon:yes gene_type:complete
VEESDWPASSNLLEASIGGVFVLVLGGGQRDFVLHAD